MAKLVSKTYGEALYEVAMESGEDKAIQLMEEIKGLMAILDENPDFDRLMKHPGIAKQEKLKVLENVFQGRVSNELEGFLNIVVSKERYSELPAIFAYFIDRVKEQLKIGVAYVISAVELSESQKEAVRAKLLETTEYQEIELKFQVDSAIIGGMIIRINDRVVDSSIRTKLDGLTKQLLAVQLS